MGYDMLSALSDLYLHAAMDEIASDGAEPRVRMDLERAADCAKKTSRVTAHTLTHPLLYGWKTETPPEDWTRLMRTLCDTLTTEPFASYRDSPWFCAIRASLSAI